ncbi:MAG: hypothetical protein LBR12_04275 [Opitutaceae bacterium]|jgi:hypothetical protein|nr:hypothetical protein [Opitutaceae bacterium]
MPPARPLAAALALLCCPAAFPSSSLPKARTVPSEIFVVPHYSPQTAESVAFASLQGQLARQGADSGIYIDNAADASGYRVWLSLMERRHGSRLSETRDLPALLARFAPRLDGHVLYDASAKGSLDAATSLAASLNAVLIEKSLEPAALAAGLKRLADASALTPETLPPARQAAARKGLVIEIPRELPASMRDYAILGDIRSFPAENSPAAEKFMARFPAGSTAFGWGNTIIGGEDDFVGRDSRLGIPLVPADHIRNLSLLSALKNTRPLRQPKTPDLSAEPHKKEHIVTLAFTDGDNPSWLLHDFATDPRWFGATGRGKLPLGWGLSPALVELTPAIVGWFYEKAAPSPDAPAGGRFLVGPSGNGYFYPSMMPPGALAEHTRNLAHLMQKADLRIVQILDFDSLGNTALWDHYLRHEQVDALLYCDYAPYDKGKGRVVWSHGKPVISARAMLWGGIQGCDAASIANLVNSASRDTTKTDAYSYIIVHAWTMSHADVEKLAALFAPDVRLVPPDEFVRLIKRAAPPAASN